MERLQGSRANVNQQKRQKVKFLLIKKEKKIKNVIGVLQKLLDYCLPSIKACKKCMCTYRKLKGK
jgi:hypothetical protein